MQSSRRQKGAKIIASLYDEDEEDSVISSPKAPNQTKASFKSRAKKSSEIKARKPMKPSILHDETEEADEDIGPVLKQGSKPSRFGLGSRKPIKPLISETPAENVTSSSIYTTEYLNELKSSTPVRQSSPSEKIKATSQAIPPASMPQTETVIIQDDDIMMIDPADDSDGFIPLDPETIQEEKDLMESRLYNEFDLEEGVGFEDEELALDKKLANIQADQRRKEMQDAINEVEDEMASENEKETQAWQSSQIKHGAFSQGIYKSSENVHLRKDRHSEVVVPPLPKLADSLDRLRGLHEKLEKKKADYIENLSALTAEVDRIKEKEEEAQEGLNQAGLNYQFAKVELESRQTSASNTAIGTPNTPGTPGLTPLD